MHRSMYCRVVWAALIAIASLAALVPARADAAVLTGTVTSSTGERMAGVTVSAKGVGATVTTSVFTDQQGDYHFPPLPAGKYRVWAQALTFATARSEVDLDAVTQQDLSLRPHHGRLRR